MAESTFTKPDGFSEVEVVTKAGKNIIKATILQADTFEAAMAHAENVAAAANENLGKDETPTTGKDVAKGWFNSLQKSGALGNKSAITNAAATDTETEDEVRGKAITKFQENAKTYLIGIMRGGRKASGILTKKENEAFGEALTKELIANKGEAPSPEKMAQIARDLGIDPTVLGLSAQ